MRNKSSRVLKRSQVSKHKSILCVLRDFPDAKILDLPKSIYKITHKASKLDYPLPKKLAPEDPSKYKIESSFCYGLNPLLKPTKYPKNEKINHYREFKDVENINSSFGAYSYSTREKHYDIRVDNSGFWNTISTALGGGFRNSQNAFLYFDEKEGRYKLRMPTPREMEFAMNWPMDWTRYGINENGDKYELSDSQRAFLCGNGIVSDIPRLIVEKYILPKLKLPLKKKLRLVSMFSGANGSCMKIPKDVFETICFYEFDKIPSSVLKYHYPETENKGDVTKDPIHKMPSCDLLITSPPCQSYSSAGALGGEDDERGKLVFHSVDYIKHHKPKYVIFENVKNFASFGKGRVLNKVLSEVSNAGYKVYIDIVNSKDHGCIQKRERTFIYFERLD